jgi:hypothetical protein
VEENLPRKNHKESNTNFRGSKYRGPSKNRKKWQVMKMISKETVRIGAIKTEQEAARIYDFLAFLTEGLNVSIPPCFLSNLCFRQKQILVIITSSSKSSFMNFISRTRTPLAS